MSSKILSVVVLLIAIFLGGCAVVQEQGPNGSTKTRVEVLGPSMNYNYGMSRGYAPGMYNQGIGNIRQPHYFKGGRPNFYYRATPDYRSW